MSVTLAELKSQARQKADMEDSEFVTDGELSTYINNSIAELYDILCEAYGAEYYVKSTDDDSPGGLPTVADQADYDLPADFYELKGVDIKINGDDWTNVEKFNFNERNRFSEFAAWDVVGLTNVRYRILGNKIRFAPIPDANSFYRLWYVPLPTILVQDTDTLDDFNAYSEYVVVDAAIKMLQKEESDVTIHMAQKQMLEKRIRDKSQNRDAAQAPTISDAYAEIDDYFWRSR